MVKPLSRLDRKKITCAGWGAQINNKSPTPCVLKKGTKFQIPFCQRFVGKNKKKKELKKQERAKTKNSPPLLKTSGDKQKGRKHEKIILDQWRADVYGMPNGCKCR